MDSAPYVSGVFAFMVLFRVIREKQANKKFILGTLYCYADYKGLYAASSRKKEPSAGHIAKRHPPFLFKEQMTTNFNSFHLRKKGGRMAEPSVTSTALSYRHRVCHPLSIFIALKKRELF